MAIDLGLPMMDGQRPLHRMLYPHAVSWFQAGNAYAVRRGALRDQAYYAAGFTGELFLVGD